MHLSSVLSLDIGVDDIGKVFTLSLGHREVNVDRLTATVTSSDGTSTVSANTVNLVQVGLLSEGAVTQRNVVDSVVDKKGNGGEVRSLVTTVLGSSRGEGGSEFANERAGSPETTSLVEEGADLGRSTAVAGGEAENESVVLLEGIRGDDGEARDGGLVGVHLAEHFFREGLSELVNVDSGTSGLGALNNLLSELSDMSIHAKHDLSIRKQVRACQYQI